MMKTRGFTLIELLVVIAILSILITLGSKGIRSARLSAKKAQARIEMASIETAVKAYRNKYGKLPLSPGQQGQAEPAFDEAFSMETILALAGENIDLNPVRMVFLEPQGATVSNGAFTDPWGEQYLIGLDSDYDGEVKLEGETILRKVAVVSVGLYYLNRSADTNDLIKSWN
ncbi:MAG: type II secretion system GspH family protein [Kiritimatiellaceae bacterium]|nr:type II secretion system GspH family protein [Kiritimatiellaceae bacterium]